MSEAHVTIAYDGEALRGGVMDVRDLAPALLAVGQLFDAANAVLNRDEAQVKVQVRATGAACFQIDFQVVQSFAHQITNFLSGETVTSAINLKELIFAGGSGLVWLIRRLRGRTPEKTEKLSESTVRLTFKEGDTLEVPLAAMRLYAELSVRAAAEKMVAEPLNKDGIDSFEVRENHVPTIKIDKAEAQYFDRPQIPDETILDDRRRAAYSIVSLAFKEDNKWRLSDGSSPISALIEDKDFLNKVDTNQIAFAKGDILLCDVHIQQRQTSSGLHTEYTVEKVVEHRPALRQLRLFDDLAVQPKPKSGEPPSPQSPQGIGRKIQP